MLIERESDSSAEEGGANEKDEEEWGGIDVDGPDGEVAGNDDEEEEGTSETGKRASSSEFIISDVLSSPI